VITVLVEEVKMVLKNDVEHLQMISQSFLERDAVEVTNQILKEQVGNAVDACNFIFGLNETFAKIIRQ
jgi:hypothetical protein